MFFQQGGDGISSQRIYVTECQPRMLRPNMHFVSTLYHCILYQVHHFHLSDGFVIQIIQNLMNLPQMYVFSWGDYSLHSLQTDKYWCCRNLNTIKLTLIVMKEENCFLLERRPSFTVPIMH